MLELKPRRTKQAAGFTLIEVLVVAAIIAVLFALTTINLGNPGSNSSLATTLNLLETNIQKQQLMSMGGDMGDTSTQQPHGLYIEANKYTLFAGSSYSSGAANNFSEDAGANIILTTTFPSSQVVFNLGDGSVAGFTNGSNTITISSNGQTHTITISRLGSMKVT